MRIQLDKGVKSVNIQRFIRRHGVRSLKLILDYLSTVISIKSREVRFAIYRKMHKLDLDRNLTLFCNNCLAGMVLHDYDLRFNSPTVNLEIPPSDYVEYLTNIDYYSHAPIIDISNQYDDEAKYGKYTGLLDGKIRLHFIHYNSFEEGVSAWRRRAMRINYNKMYAILVKRFGCKEDDIKKFLALDPKLKKIVLVDENSEMKGENIVKIKGCCENGQIGNVLGQVGIFGKRYYDQIDWLEFLKALNN